MSIRFACQYCHKEVKAPDSAAGKRGKCPYCGQDNYIPQPVSDDELLPLAPVDEEEERRAEAERMRLLEQEREILSQTGGEPSVPLEHRQDLTSEDLHHFIVNYCLDLFAGQNERAQTHVSRLKEFGGLALTVLEDFLTGKAVEPALKEIPPETLQRFLRQLGDQL